MSKVVPAAGCPIPQPRRSQDTSIQALRGIAVILMVSGHVIGIGGRGLRVPDNSIWHFFYVALEDMRMPLFTLISGYVYAMVPVAKWSQYPQLMKGKSRRLLLPLVTVGTLQYVLASIVSGQNFNPSGIPIWRIYVFGFEHLWFLQSIFLIFLAVGILDSLRILDTPARWAGVTAMSALLFVAVEVPVRFDVFTISGAIRLLPFFLIGYGLRRHSLFDLRRAAALVVTLLFLSCYMIRMLTIFDVLHPNAYANRALTLAVGATALILSYSARRYLSASWLAWVGGFSFGIYLLHDLATAATRVGLERVGVHHLGLMFLLGLVMGVSAPIVFQLMFRNVAVVQTYLLGERRTVGKHQLRRPGLMAKTVALARDVVGVPNEAPRAPVPVVARD